MLDQNRKAGTCFAGTLQSHHTPKVNWGKGRKSTPLRFRHYGAARRAWRAQRVIGGGKLGSCKLRWRSHGGKAGRVLRAAAEPGNASSVGNMICQRWDRRRGGSAGWMAALVWDYGDRAFSNKEYCSCSMRLSFSRNLPRAGSVRSSRMRPNSANVSKQNRWR